MMLEPHNRPATHQLAFRDLYLAVATSTTLVVAIGLAATVLCGSTAAHALVAALCGAAFGSVPVAVLGTGAMAVLAGTPSPAARSINRAWTIALVGVILAASTVGVFLALALYLLYAA
jgi:hypothetical protein